VCVCELAYLEAERCVMCEVCVCELAYLEAVRCVCVCVCGIPGGCEVCCDEETTCNWTR